MFRLLLIWFCLGWTAFIFAQSSFDNFSIAYPELVHQNESFQVSIITSDDIINADHLDLYLIPKEGITPINVIIESENETKELKFSTVYSDQFLQNTLMCSIDLEQIVSHTSGSFFQILIKFKSEFVEYSEIDFYGEFRKDNSVIDYLNSSEEKLFADDPNCYRIKINFYSLSGDDEKALQLNPNSEFKISPVLKLENDLLVEFWLKLNQMDFPFLQIKNKQSGLIEYRLITNKFQIVIPESDFNREIKIAPEFISKNVWTHFTVLFSFNKNEIEFYCGKMLIAEFELNSSLKKDNLEFCFVSSGESTIQLDQLRFVDFNEPVENSFSNIHFANFVSEKSFIKKQFGFNKTSLQDLMLDESFVFSNVVLVPSDAPIFKRAPELNLKIMNNYYELSWVGGDYKNAKSYILERAEDNKTYEEIFKANADNLEEKTYSFLSEKIPGTEVLYFRIKQINKNRRHQNSPG